MVTPYARGVYFAPAPVSLDEIHDFVLRAVQHELEYVDTQGWYYTTPSSSVPVVRWTHPAQPNLRIELSAPFDDHPRQHCPQLKLVVRYQHTVVSWTTWQAMEPYQENEDWRVWFNPQDEPFPTALWEIVRKCCRRGGHQLPCPPYGLSEAIAAFEGHLARAHPLDAVGADEEAVR